MIKMKHEKHIFHPSWQKIMLSTAMTLLVIFGWIGLIRTPNIGLGAVILYFILTSIWIGIAIIASCCVIHFSKHSRIAKVITILIITMFFFSSLTVAYAVWK